jgi:hypothetical protein
MLLDYTVRKILEAEHLQQLFPIDVIMSLEQLSMGIHTTRVVNVSSTVLRYITVDRHKANSL